MLHITMTSTHCWNASDTWAGISWMVLTQGQDGKGVRACHPRSMASTRRGSALCTPNLPPPDSNTAQSVPLPAQGRALLRMHSACTIRADICHTLIAANRHVKPTGSRSLPAFRCEWGKSRLFQRIQIPASQRFCIPSQSTHMH
jgi:hypothetical protein